MVLAARSRREETVKIDLSALVGSRGSVREVECILEMDVFSSRMGDFPLTNKSPFVLVITNVDNKEITVAGEVSLTARTNCDRCLEELETPIHFTIDKHLKITADGLVDEEMEQTDYMIGLEMDVERLAYTEILVNWPAKVLCREDCKGICRICGKNLNSGTCSCQQAAPDPRMAAIQEIFNSVKEV